MISLPSPNSPKSTAKDSESLARPSKKTKIIEAALDIFLHRGYAMTSMDAIACRAAVSKSTLYAHFSNKRAIFGAVVSLGVAPFAGGLSIPERIDDLRLCLKNLANSYCAMICTPDSLAMYRVVLAESPKQPEIGSIFYNAGIADARRSITNLFRSLSHRDLLYFQSDDEPEIASDLFLSMLAGAQHQPALFGMNTQKPGLAKRIEMAVDLLICRFGRKGH